MAKKSAEYYASPCKKEHATPSHRYQVHSRTPFGVRCSMPECGIKLHQPALLLAFSISCRPGWPVRLGLGLSDILRVVLLWGWSLMSLLFPDNFLYTQLMLILVGDPCSCHYSAPEYTWCQALVLRHGSGDLISISHF